MSEAFDRFTKMLAGGATRRDALKYLGGLAGGLLAGLTGRARADDDHHHDGDDDDDDHDHDRDDIGAACIKYCRACPRKPRFTFGHCMSHCVRFLHRNPKGTLCGTCTAKAPFTGCGSGATCCTPKGAAAYCTNTNTSAKNCGACGTVCASSTPTCCSGTCVDLTSDSKNCGKCGNVCASGKTCKSSACA